MKQNLERDKSKRCEFFIFMGGTVYQGASSPSRWNPEVWR